MLLHVLLILILIELLFNLTLTTQLQLFQQILAHVGLIGSSCVASSICLQKSYSVLIICSLFYSDPRGSEAGQRVSGVQRRLLSGSQEPCWWVNRRISLVLMMSQLKLIINAYLILHRLLGSLTRIYFFLTCVQAKSSARMARSSRK